MTEPFGTLSCSAPAGLSLPSWSDVDGTAVPVRLADQVVAAIRERAAALGVASRIWPLTAFAVLLARYAGVTDVAVEVRDSGRCAVLPVTIDEEAGLADAVLAMWDMLAAAGDRAPTDHRTLTLCVTDDDLTGELRAPGWTRCEAERFADALATACRELARPHGTVASVRGISPRGIEMLRRLNDTARPFPRTSIDTLVLAQARARPGAVAVRDESGELSYRDLVRAAGALAGALRDAGVRPGHVVGIAVPRGADEVVALLGTLLAGAAYTSIDEQLPDHRLAQLLEAARPAAVVCAGVAALPGTGPPRVAVRQPVRAHTVPFAAPDPNRVAYVPFTSGSTGAPKGVAVRHLGIVRLVHDAPALPLGSHTRMLRMSPLGFDPSSLEVWGPLCHGGRIEVHPPGLPAPAQLGRFLVARKVTTLWLTAGSFRVVAEFAPSALSTVECLITGGEVVSPEHVRAVLAANPGLTVVNGYGPTESTTFATAHAIDRPDEVDSPLPIGRLWPNTRGYVLDAGHRLLPPGAVGELFLAGDGLAAGYNGDQAHTAWCFGYFSPDVDEPLYRTGDLVRIDGSGRFWFLGRRDDQVKLSGVRVEPEEIRQVLRTHPRVRDAVVVAAGATPNRYLVAGYTAHDDAAAPTAKELADFTAARLPGYMVPARWASVPDFPLTSNGKVDHATLRALARLPSDR